MKKLSNLLAALVFVSLVIFISCSSDSTDPADPLADQAALLNGAWNVSDVGYISGGLPDVPWTGFTLTISNATSTGGSYATSNVPDGFSDVWPSSGTWTFDTDASSTGRVITRSDGVSISISNLTDNSATLSFDIATAGRISGIDGDWDFDFTQ